MARKTQYPTDKIKSFPQKLNYPAEKSKSLPQKHNTQIKKTETLYTKVVKSVPEVQINNQIIRVVNSIIYIYRQRERERERERIVPKEVPDELALKTAQQLSLALSVFSSLL